jgi:secreted trypsin-like serine protease
MMMFINLILLAIPVIINGQFHGDLCFRKIDDQPGICEFFENCPSAKVESDRTSNKPDICSFKGRRAVICCKKEGQHISVKKCEDYKKLDKSNLEVFGGEDTKTGEFPHMAAIGYEESNGIKFNCGGSLISERFVLTAAHCLQKKSPPVIVRLGDQNLKSTNDKAQPQEFRVKNYIRHESYSSKAKYYDIGLIELDGEARLTKSVRPACLWQEMQFPSQTATATGWGNLEYLGPQSEELQKVSLTLMQNRDCRRYLTHIVKYTDILKQGLVDSQLCAAAIEGGRLGGGKDTCQGDSGGPLQITLKGSSYIFYLVGLTSFAPAGCGDENSPGVYTRVSEYIDWIESRVWP